MDAIRFSVTPGAEKESRAAMLRHHNDLIAAAQLPEEQGAAFARLEARGRLPLLARQVGPHGAVGERFREGRAELRVPPSSPWLRSASAGGTGIGPSGWTS